MPDESNIGRPVLPKEFNRHQYIKDTIVKITGESVVESKRAYPLTDELMAQYRKDAEGRSIKPAEGARKPYHPVIPLGRVEQAFYVPIRGPDNDMCLTAIERLALYAGKF
jgi:hypothetical protein